MGHASLMASHFPKGTVHVCTNNKYKIKQKRILICWRSNFLGTYEIHENWATNTGNSFDSTVNSLQETQFKISKEKITMSPFNFSAWSVQRDPCWSDRAQKIGVGMNINSTLSKICTSLINSGCNFNWWKYLNYRCL